VDTSAVLSILDFRTCPSAKGNTSSTDWRYSVRVQKETRARRIGGTASLTPLAATYCVDLDMRLLLPRQPKREMLTLSDLKATGVIKSVCPTNGRCSAHAYVSSLSLIVSVSSVYYDGVVRTVIWVTGPC